MFNIFLKFCNCLVIVWYPCESCCWFLIVWHLSEATAARIHFPSDCWIKSNQIKVAWISSEIDFAESCIILSDWLEKIFMTLYFLLFYLYQKLVWRASWNLSSILSYKWALLRWTLLIGLLKGILTGYKKTFVILEKWTYNHHHHQGVSTVWILLILFCHPSLSVITLGKSAWLHPVFAPRWWM